MASINFLVSGNQKIVQNLDVSGNIDCSGIYYGNGSGLTHVNPGVITDTSGAFAVFDVSSGELEASTLMNYDVSNNINMTTLADINMNAAIIDIIGNLDVSGSTDLSGNLQVFGNTYLNNFLAIDGGNQVILQEYNVQSVSNTPIQFQGFNFSFNSTCLLNFYIVGNAISPNEGNGIVFSGCLAANQVGLGPVTLVLSSVTNALTIPIPLSSSIATANYAFTASGGQIICTITGVSAITIDWIMRLDNVTAI